jgi:hypothetical protein
MSEDPFSVYFADKGAWHAYAFDERYAFEVRDLRGGQRCELDVTGKIEERVVHADRLEARCRGGGRVTLRFLDARTAEIETEGRLTVQARSPGPFRLLQQEPGRFHHVNPEGPRGALTLDGLPRTVRWNWRAAAQGDGYGGPALSPHSHDGPLTRDVWELVTILPRELAREQVNAILAHQRADGRLPAMLLAAADESDRGSAAPPLAAWACAQQPGLLDEFRSALERHLRWWEVSRRPPGGQLFTAVDLASTPADGPLRLSVAASTWICREKRLLGEPDDELEALVNDAFFHDTGAGPAFHDVLWPSMEPVPSLTSDCWVPLAAGVATEGRARDVLAAMRDPERFATPLPFPSVARCDPGFDADDPEHGAAHPRDAAIAIEALLKHGATDEARHAAERLLADPEDWECYDPLTGVPTLGSRPAVPQCSRTAVARARIRGLVADA